MNQIIVPIDFSQYSENAFLTAVKIASRRKTKITCINVVSSDLDWNSLSEKEKSKHVEIVDLEIEAKEKLADYLAAHEVENVDLEGVVEVGIPYEVIVQKADQDEADLIVIGAYGKGHQEGRFIGSNLQKVLRLASCAVLAVKHEVSNIELGKMAFASLFNQITLPAFLGMVPFIQWVDAEVHFLFVRTPETDKKHFNFKERMGVYAQTQLEMIIHEHVHEFAEVEKGIIDFSEKNDIGWIGIASNSRKASSTYRVGVTETIIFKSEFPVLSVKLE